MRVEKETQIRVQSQIITIITVCFVRQINKNSLYFIH